VYSCPARPRPRPAWLVLLPWTIEHVSADSRHFTFFTDEILTLCHRSTTVTLSYKQRVERSAKPRYPLLYLAVHGHGRSQDFYWGVCTHRCAVILRFRVLKGVGSGMGLSPSPEIFEFFRVERNSALLNWWIMCVTSGCEVHKLSKFAWYSCPCLPSRGCTCTPAFLWLRLCAWNWISRVRPLSSKYTSRNCYSVSLITRNAQLTRTVVLSVRRA